MSESMSRVQLSPGAIEYVDSGGSGPVVVLLHGLLMDHSLWRQVIADLSRDHRCLAPILPLGCHRLPLGVDADLSMRGIAGLVAEFLERLDLEEVTLVGNDTGGVLVQLLAADDLARLKRIVLASCDAFDNYPPGAPGKAVVLLGKLPPAAFGLFMQQLRLKPARRLPISFGWLTRRGDETVRGWIGPVLRQPEIRRELVRVLRAVPAEPDLLITTAERLRHFRRAALIVWAEEDRVMPPAHARRLAELLPVSRVVEVADSYTLIPLDQPTRFAGLIREFIHAESENQPRSGSGADS